MTNPPAISKSISRRKRLLLGAGAGVVVVSLCVGAGLVVERRAIGARLAVEYLRRRGVPATLHLDLLGWSGLSGSAVLGRPDQPDLTIEHFEVQFAKPPKGETIGAVPSLKSIILVGPHLRASLDGGRLHFGALQPLIDDALKPRAGGGGPTPDITIRDGRFDLTSAYGHAILAVSTRLRHGRIETADISLAPADMAYQDYRAKQATGRLSVKAIAADRVHIDLHLAAASAQATAGRAVGADFRLAADAPYDGRTPSAPNGPLSGHAILKLNNLSAGACRVLAGSGDADFNGALQSTTAGTAFVGPVALNVMAGVIEQAGFRATHAKFGFQSPNLALKLADKTLYADGAYDARLTAEQGRVASKRQTVMLSKLNTAGRGRLHVASRHVALQFRGLTSVAAALSPADAQRLASPATGAGDPAKLRDVVAKNLEGVQLKAADFSLTTDGQAFGVVLHAPVTADFAAGAQARLTPAPDAPLVDLRGGVVQGGVSALIAGPGLPRLELQSARYRIGQDAQGLTLQTQANLVAKGDVGPLHGAALNAKLAVARRQGQVLVTVADCADIAIAAYQQGATFLASAVGGKLCPTASPLLTLQPSSWTLSARLSQVGADVTSTHTKLEDGEALVLANSGKGAASGSVKLDKLVLRDTATETRFRPIQTAGLITLSDPRVHGRLTLSLVKPASPLGVLTLDHDVKSATGQATLDAPSLVFAPKELQPASIAPTLGKLASNVTGALNLRAHFNWSQGKLVSGADAQTASLSLKSLAGQVSGLRGTVHFDSLAPLTTPLGQTLVADKLDAVLPVTGLNLRFGLGATQLTLQSASATVAKGQVSLSPTTIPILANGGAGASISDTVTLKGVDLQEVISGLNLSKAVSIEARLDGVLPITVSPAGLRIAGGRLEAEGPGRLSVRREALTGAVATGGAAGAQPNAVQDFAYQALENLAFDQLDASVASRPQGRLGLVLHVKGRHDPPTNPPSRISLLDLMRGHAFDKPIPLPKSTPVDLTLDTSLNLDELLSEYAGLNGLTRPGNRSDTVQPH